MARGPQFADPCSKPSDRPVQDDFEVFDDGPAFRFDEQVAQVLGLQRAEVVVVVLQRGAERLHALPVAHRAPRQQLVEMFLRK